MTSFVIANLGDASLNVTQGTLTGSGTISSTGITFIANGTSAPITVTVQRGLSLVFIKDELGNANHYPITVVAQGGVNIDAASSVVIALSYGWLVLSDNGTTYSILGINT